MPNRLVRHSKQNLWAVIAPGRLKRPDETGAVGGPPSPGTGRYLASRKASEGKKKPKEAKDPFAPGNEALTPPEVMRIGEGKPDEPGWKVRVVPNKFPIFDLHEVVILHPELLDFGEISGEHAALVFQAYRGRYNALKNKGLVFIFHNIGRNAGASLKHPHSQITVIPKEVSLSFEDPPKIENAVKETDRFVAFCPEFSQRPYEVWILRKRGGKEFGDFDDQELAELATLVNQLTKKMRKVLNNPDYNFLMRPGKNWYLRLFPRLTVWGPVELGAGIAVNPVDPAEAARALRD